MQMLINIAVLISLSNPKRYENTIIINPERSNPPFYSECIILMFFKKNPSKIRTETITWRLALFNKKLADIKKLKENIERDGGKNEEEQ